MLNRVLILIIAFTLILCNVYTPVLALSAAEARDLTIYTDKPNYRLAKLEPAEGIYLGAYVLQDTFINYDMSRFNEMTNKQHASFFKYVGYGMPFPKEWVEEVKAVGAVPHIAFEPNRGLHSVQDDEYLRSFAKDAYASGVPIFLRYASEMNGTWAAYSGDPALYIDKWKLIHDVMEEEAPNVAMVWTVFTFPENTILDYYPGDDYVDWVGVNIYNVMYHNNSLKHKGDKEDPLDLLDYVYNTFSHSKPIQISEYGVTHFSITDNQYHIEFAKQKISRLYKHLPTKYPRVKSIFYFDVNNLINAPEGRKINDYSITNEPEILQTYATWVSSASYLSSVHNKPGAVMTETLSYRGNLFASASGTLYVDQAYFKDALGLDVAINGNIATVSDGRTSIKRTIVYKSIPRTFYNKKYVCIGLPLRDIATQFGYWVHYDKDNNTIQVKPKKSA